MKSLYSWNFLCEILKFDVIFKIYTVIIVSIRLCSILYLAILLNLRHKSSANISSEKIQTYIISASDLFCLKFRPVSLYSFYMLFYTILFWIGLCRNNQSVCYNQTVRLMSKCVQFDFSVFQISDRRNARYYWIFTK